MTIDRVSLVALSSLFSILGLWILVFRLYRDYRVDAFRQELFGLRDRLFDLGLSGEIPFDELAYGMLRRTINGFIRFAHRISLAQFLVFLFLSGLRLPAAPDTFRDEWGKATKRLSPEKQRRLDGYIQDMNVIVLKHMLLGSPILLALMLATLVPFVFFVICYHRMYMVADYLRRPMDRMSSVAVVCGR